MHVHLSRALLAYFYDVPVLLGKSLLENATLLGSQLREVELINGRSFDSLAERTGRRGPRFHSADTRSAPADQMKAEPSRPGTGTSEVQSCISNTVE